MTQPEPSRDSIYVVGTNAMRFDLRSPSDLRVSTGEDVMGRISQLALKREGNFYVMDVDVPTRLYIKAGLEVA